MITFYAQDSRPDLPKLRNVTVDPKLGIGDWVRYEDGHHVYLARYGSSVKVMIQDKDLRPVYAWLIPGEQAQIKAIE